jgi:hypothetical protein
MHNPTSALALWFAIASSVGCARPEPQIERASVERIVTTLSTDDMLGRRAFTPSADSAAEFIRAEFESIGLETFDGLAGYLQPFPVYALTVESSRVFLNGRDVPDERLAISLAAESIHWTTDDAVQVAVVGPDDNLMRAFSAARRSDANTIVLIDPSHEGSFGRLRGFMSGPSRTVDIGSGTSMVLVMTDETSATSYEIDVTASVEELPLANVVGVIPGRRRDELVIFSGHHDHIGVRVPVEGDSIANGANDNASGTTAVIELARYFEAKGRPGRTLVFVAFAAEEMGGFGSQYFASQVDPDEIVAMFNIEMIGKVAAEGPNAAWITGFDRSDFGEILQQAAEGTEYTFHPDPYPDWNLFFRSDNATFARLGVPAHSISTTPIDVDEDYHRVSDEVETLDLEHMTSIIRAIARGAATIVSGSATPTRIDPSQLN